MSSYDTPANLGLLLDQLFQLQGHQFAGFVLGLLNALIEVIVRWNRADLMALSLSPDTAAPEHVSELHEPAIGRFASRSDAHTKHDIRGARLPIADEDGLDEHARDRVNQTPDAMLQDDGCVPEDPLCFHAAYPVKPFGQLPLHIIDPLDSTAHGDLTELRGGDCFPRHGSLLLGSVVQLVIQRSGRDTPSRRKIVKGTIRPVFDSEATVHHRLIRIRKRPTEPA